MTFKGMTAVCLIAGGVMIGGTATAEEASEAAIAGERDYKVCVTCHTFDESKQRMGPHLIGIIGRTAGASEGYNYSKAMTESGIVWDEENLAEYIKNPRSVVPGTKMFFRLGNEEKVARIIEYLKTQ